MASGGPAASSADDDLVRLGRAEVDALDHEGLSDHLQDCTAHRHTI
jgi:hypothetical protein